MRNWTTDRIMNKVSMPFPSAFPLGSPTIFDLVPLMSFQQKIDPELKLRQLVGSVSVSLGSSRKKLKSKEHDINYSVNTANPRETSVKFDGNDAIKQNTVWNQILDDLGAEITELNITTRVPIIKATSEINSEIDSYWLLQRKTGNFTRSTKSRFGLRNIRNPYLQMRNELKESDLWQKQYRHKLRGILKTTNIVGNDGTKLVPWENILKTPENHRFPPQMNALNNSLVSEKWWQDNGVPIRLLGSANSYDVEATVYMLNKRGILIAA